MKIVKVVSWIADAAFKDAICFLNDNVADFAIKTGLPLPYGEERTNRYDKVFTPFYNWFKHEIDPFCSSFTFGGDFWDGRNEYEMIRSVRIKEGELERVKNICRKAGVMIKNGKSNLKEFYPNSLR